MEIHDTPLSLRIALIISIAGTAWAIKIDSFIDKKQGASGGVSGSRLRALETPMKAFDLSDVELHKTTFQSRAEASNLEYLLQLEPDRMLYVFRANAKLPTPGVPFWGTWVRPILPESLYLAASHEHSRCSPCTCSTWLTLPCECPPPCPPHHGQGSS